MVSPITRDWQKEEQKPSFGFLVTNTTPSFPEHVDTCLTDTPDVAILGSPGTGTNIIESLSVILRSLFNRPPVIVRSVIYQPYAGSCYQTCEDALTIERQKFHAISELRRKVTGFSSLSKNWDNEQADPIAQTTIITALKVIEGVAVVLSRKHISSGPSVRAFPDGSIFFKWIYGDKELALTVLEGVIEAQRWQPLESVRSLGLWEIRTDEVLEHVEWILA